MVYRHFMIIERKDGTMLRARGQGVIGLRSSAGGQYPYYGVAVYSDFRPFDPDTMQEKRTPESFGSPTCE
jgi:hypothetical protein